MRCHSPGRSGAALLATLCLAAAAPVVHADASDATRWAALRDEARTYEHGEGRAKDAFHAFELYCRAAREGDAEAQYAIGWMYTNGRGVERSDPLASAFFGLAAEQGHAQARNMLAVVGPSTDDLPECMRDMPLVRYDDTPIDLGIRVPEDVATFVATTPEQRKVVQIVQSIAPAYDVSPLLAIAFIRAESNFDPAARSPKNAQGLMQLIPETSARFNVKKPYDPVQNIHGGLAYLRWLLAYFRGNVSLVAAAYNAGERTVERYRGIPPYAETREYVKRILAVFRKSEHPFDPTVTDPSPELPRIVSAVTR